jgi:hypothetical protein
MSEHEMRIEQFKRALALASKRLSDGDVKGARYWLDGAYVVADAIERTSYDAQVDRMRAAGL